MILWRVQITIKTVGKRKARVHEFVVLAKDKIEAKEKAVEAQHPEANEPFTVTAEPWDTDVVRRRTYLD